MASGFNNSFEKAFNPALVVGANAALETIKEKIKLDATKAEEAAKVASNLSVVAELSKDSDQATQERLAKILEMKHTPDSSKAILDFAAQQVKDKKDQSQAMQTAAYTGQMSFIPEVTKEMVASGKYTPEQAQDFAALASRIAQKNVGFENAFPGNAPGVVVNQPNIPKTAGEQMSDDPAMAMFRNTLPQKLSAEQEKVKAETSTALDNFEGLMSLFKGSPQGVISGNIAEAVGNLTGGAVNTKGAVFKDLSPMVSGQIYIGMTGDTRLSEADAEARAKPLLPKQGDSPKKNNLKEDFMRLTLEERNRRYGAGDFKPINQKELLKNFNEYVSSGGKKGGWDSGNLVEMENPDGTKVKVHPTRVEEAEKDGLKKVGKKNG